MMNIYEQRQGTTTILSLEGQLDALCAPALEKQLQKLPETFTEVILDFSELTYVSSAGLRVILQGLKWTNAKKGKFSIKNIPNSVREVFEMTGLIDIFVRDEKFVIIQKERNENSIAFSLAGELDSKAASALDSQLQQLEDEGFTTITLDFTAVKSVSLEGQSVLADAEKRISEKQRTLVIQNFITGRS
jgi:anti-sigma B factor antagonist